MKFTLTVVGIAVELFIWIDGSHSNLGSKTGPAKRDVMGPVGEGKDNPDAYSSSGYSLEGSGLQDTWAAGKGDLDAGIMLRGIPKPVVRPKPPAQHHPNVDDGPDQPVRPIKPGKPDVDGPDHHQIRPGQHDDPDIPRQPRAPDNYRNSYYGNSPNAEHSAQFAESIGPKSFSQSFQMCKNPGAEGCSKMANFGGFMSKAGFPMGTALFALMFINENMPGLLPSLLPSMLTKDDEEEKLEALQGDQTINMASLGMGTTNTGMVPRQGIATMGDSLYVMEENSGSQQDASVAYRKTEVADDPRAAFREIGEGNMYDELLDQDDYDGITGKKADAHLMCSNGRVTAMALSLPLFRLARVICPL